MHEIDRWILLRAEELVRRCRAWYEELAFHRVYQALYSFATTDLSAIYFDVLKDRLYTAAPRSLARRSAQTALARINDALVRMLAPMLSYTCEEVWKYMTRPADAPDSVHLTLFPEPEELTAGFAAVHRASFNKWERLVAVRDQVLKSLEVARQAKFIGAPLEARLRLSAGDELYPLLAEYKDVLPGLFIVSQVSLENGAGVDFSVHVDRAEGRKCERCWKYTTDVGAHPDLPTICGACAEAVMEMNPH
jgi:isoleucyl-tRNA synthetase